VTLAIYLDDSQDNDLLIALLRRAGHTVVSPREVTLRGSDDLTHLEYAAQNGYALLTADVRDFETLHRQWQQQGRQHAGILLVHYEGNVRKDMTAADIVRAIERLLMAGVAIPNQVHRLNQWR
jgi:predicted nuclease of predicted toxin-antitoxin system